MKMRAGIDVRKALDRNSAGQGVKTVEDQADRRVIDLFDDRPGLAVVPNVLPPCQRLVADTQAPRSGALAQLTEVLDDAVRDRGSAAGETFEQTSIRSVPSSCMTSNLRSMRSNTRARRLSGIPSKSLKG